MYAYFENNCIILSRHRKCEKIVIEFEFKIEFKLSEAPIAHKTTLYGKP